MYVFTTLTLGGACLAYSGLRGISKEKDDGAKAYQMTKVALGVAIVAHQVISLSKGTALTGFITPFWDQLVERKPQEVCDLKVLREKIASSEPLIRSFGILRNRRGVSCENFLPWKSSFATYTGIFPKDLSRPVMWGMDPLKRPFIAIRYTCDNVVKRAMYMIEAQSGMYHFFGGSSCVPINWNYNSWKDVQWLSDLFRDGYAETQSFGLIRLA